jgi:hypothetical protein
MSLIKNIKKRLVISSMQKAKKKPHDLLYLENYQLPETPLDNETNSYYFSAHTLDGVSLYTRVAYRGDGTTEVWFVYHLNDKHLYRLTKSVYKKGENLPIILKCVEPTKVWEITFSSIVFDETTSKDVAIDMSARFVATSPIFDFTYDIDPTQIASALAEEKWDKAFKENKDKNQQVHYEQMGEMTLKISIQGALKTFTAPCIRDHSFGTRDWGYMNQHVWLMALISKTQCLNLSMVSYPHMTHLQTGYYETDHKFINISKATTMREITLNGDVPDHFFYTIDLPTNEQFEIYATKDTRVTYEFDNGNYVIQEGTGTFLINGEKARGIMEFGYNKDQERWISKYENK